MLPHSGSGSLWPRGLQPARLLCPWGFSRQGYWHGLPFSSPGDLPEPGVAPTWLASPGVAGGLLNAAPPGSQRGECDLEPLGFITPRAGRCFPIPRDLRAVDVVFLKFSELSFRNLRGPFRRNLEDRFYLVQLSCWFFNLVSAAQGLGCYFTAYLPYFSLASTPVCKKTKIFFRDGSLKLF